MNPWVPFGADHAAALATVLAASLVLVCASRRLRGESASCVLRVGLAGALLALLAGELFLAWRGGWLSWTTLLPLQLCDLAVLLAAYALVSRDARVVGLLYFWALTGTLLAMVMPDLLRGFPSIDYLVFFGLHGLVVAAAATLVFGLRLVPGPRAWWQAFLFTLAYAALVGLVNATLHTNFMYLCRKPEVPTLLDWFGPWPAYLGTSAVLALALFRLLDLPLARLRARGSPPARATFP